VNAFAIGFQPTVPGQLDEPMFAALEKVRGGTHHAANPAPATGSAPGL
jgi:hypothetical protein